MAALKKHNLNDWIDDELATHVVGVSSHLPDYQFAFFINKLTGCRLKSSPYLYNTDQESKNGSFCIYKGLETKSFPDLYLVVNQSVFQSNQTIFTPLFGDLAVESRKFLQNLAQWDYLLIGNDYEQMKKHLIPAIKKRFKVAHLFDFEQLKKHDRHTLTTFYYENKC